MIRILLADDHLLFRAGVRGLLEARGGFSVVAEASAGEEAVQQAVATQPDMAVLDIAMPGWGGLEAAREIKRRCKKTRVLILTARPEDHVAVRCLKAGADGYLTKQAPPDQLVAVLRKIHGGARYASAELWERVLAALAAPEEQPLAARLSDREYQVMCLMASGHTVGMAAAALHLSVQTVGTYRGRILVKLGLKNNLELIAYALEAGLGQAGPPPPPG